MRRLFIIAPIGIAAVLVAGFLLLPGTQPDPGQGLPEASSGAGARIVAVTLPDQLSPQATIGKVGFESKCAVCHGENAAGQDGVAPPLVHKIYEPSHHGDDSFWLATQNGVRSHHWSFGNMPPIDGLTRADVRAITTYVRELQRANGIN